MAAPIIWNGDFAKLLKDQLKIGEKVFFLSGSANPTSTAQDAPAGSLYFRDTGLIYRKNDAGSTTNWSELATTAGISFPILAPDGSVASPSYGFASDGDQDTGMYTSGDGNISWAANGQLAMHLDYPGNLTVIGTISASNYPPTGNTNAFAGYDNAGALTSIPSWRYDDTLKGQRFNITYQPSNVGYNPIHDNSVFFDPSISSPNDTWVMQHNYIEFDINDTGFAQGTDGNAARMQDNYFQHQGTGNIGEINFFQNNFNLGNGTDPINVKGISYSYGFGTINANVTVSGPTQGYGFQPNFQTGSALDPSNSQITAFYDSTSVHCDSYGHVSFAAGPTIDSVASNHNYTAFSSSANITNFVGNAGYTGLGIFPNIGTIDTQGNFQGVNISPNITLNKNSATGINVYMNNVTNYAGAQASLVVQDITYTINQAGTDGNNITVEYTDTTTAGNEVAILSGGQHIQVSIESGVSTATQVLAALAANFSIASNATITITGVGSNPQVTYAQTNLAGGINAGNKKAAYFGGDVQIDGALSFTGGLSIGALNSFASVDISGYPGGVNSIDTLITQPHVPNGTTLNTDILAINTAMLLTIGDSCTLTSSFLGYTALGLPAVLSMGTGSTIDHVTGATFAISLDVGAAGGTADTVDLCRALAIPNGVTAINKLRGYTMDLPFGDPGTQSWGMYISPAINNWLAGNLLVGGTAGSDDTVTNSSVGIQIKSTTKAFVNANMTTTEKLALSALPGMQVFDTTLNQMSYYNGTIWVNF